MKQMTCHMCGKPCTSYFNVEIHLYTPKNTWVKRRVGWCNKHKALVRDACDNMGFIKP